MTLRNAFENTALESTQTDVRTAVQSIDSKTPALSGGAVPVTMASSALPTGAATATLQGTGNTSLASIDTKTPALSGGAVPVVLASVPLPTGAATSAKQPALGTAVTAASMPVNLASDDAQIGAKTSGSTISSGGTGIIGWLSDAVTQLKSLVATKDTNGILKTVAYDSTGAVIDVTAAVPVSFPTSILSGSGGWSIASSGFVNPSYAAATLTDSTGFSTDGYGSVTMAYEGTFGAVTAVNEQTLDPTGATGWFQVYGSPAASSTISVPSSGVAATATAFVFMSHGVRHRMRITAIASGTLVVRALLERQTAPKTPGVINVLGNTSVGIAMGASTLPIATGGRTGTAPPATTTGDGQAQLLQVTPYGALVVKVNSIAELTWSYPAASGGIANTTTAVTVKTAAAAGVRNYITGIQIDTEALTTATEFAVRDGAAGTVLWRMKIPAATAFSRHVDFTSSPLRGTAATLLEVVTLTASGTGAVYANLQGYTAP